MPPSISLTFLFTFHLPLPLSVSLLLPVFSRSFLPTLSPPDFVYRVCVCVRTCICLSVSVSACEKKVSSLVRRRAAALVFLLACAIEGDVRQAPDARPSLADADGG